MKFMDYRRFRLFSLILLLGSQIAMAHSDSPASSSVVIKMGDRSRERITDCIQEFQKRKNEGFSDWTPEKIQAFCDRIYSPTADLLLVVESPRTTSPKAPLKNSKGRTNHACTMPTWLSYQSLMIDLPADCSQYTAAYLIDQLKQDHGAQYPELLEGLDNPALSRLLLDDETLVKTPTGKLSLERFCKNAQNHPYNQERLKKGKPLQVSINVDHRILENQVQLEPILREKQVSPSPDVPDSKCIYLHEETLKTFPRSEILENSANSTILELIETQPSAEAIKRALEQARESHPKSN